LSRKGNEGVFGGGGGKEKSRNRVEETQAGKQVPAVLVMLPRSGKKEVA